jgi:acyl carrier protein
MNTLPVAERNDCERDLASEVRTFILDLFPLARKNRVQNSDALLESGIIDSLGILEVVAFIERTFSTTVADEELSPENFQTIDRIATFISSKIAGRQPGSGMQ